MFKISEAYSLGNVRLLVFSIFKINLKLCSTYIFFKNQNLPQLQYALATIRQILNGILNLLKNSIILGELIINVNILIMPEMRPQKQFYFKPLGGLCYRSRRAKAYNFEFDLQTLYIYYILFLAWLISSMQTACIFPDSSWQFSIYYLS